MGSPDRSRRYKGSRGSNSPSSREHLYNSQRSSYKFQSTNHSDTRTYTEILFFLFSFWNTLSLICQSQNISFKVCYLLFGLFKNSKGQLFYRYSLVLYEAIVDVKGKKYRMNFILKSILYVTGTFYTKKIILKLKNNQY